MSGADIIKTLIELLEAQEQIKITYKVGDVNNDRTIQTPAASS
jgi:hypothetical protein